MIRSLVRQKRLWHPDYMKDTEKGEIESLRAEALTGLTFSKIAPRSHPQEKTDRNRAKARKAYDTLLGFMPGDNAIGSVGGDSSQSSRTQVRERLLFLSLPDPDRIALIV